MACAASMALRLPLKAWGATTMRRPPAAWRSMGVLLYILVMDGLWAQGYGIGTVEPTPESEQASIGAGQLPDPPRPLSTRGHVWRTGQRGGAAAW